jgi:hypothetical protein
LERSADLVWREAVEMLVGGIIQQREVMPAFVLVDTGTTQGTDHFLIDRTQLMSCTQAIERLDQQ